MAKPEDSVVATLSKSADEARAWFNDNVRGQNDQVDQVLKQVDSGRAAVMEQAAIATKVASEQVEEAKTFVNKSAEVYKQYENLVFDHLQKGVYWSFSHPFAAGASSLLLLSVVAKGPRRFLVRNTVGRFWNEEALLSSAERRVEALRQDVGLLKQEREKLDERVNLGLVEFQSGYQKLRDAGARVSSLSRTVMKTENRAAGLKDDLRELPARQAIKLRADVATLEAEAHAYRKALEKRLASLARLQVPI
ncbi:hypothetical protein KFL_000740240 [Klebsormidium nitens]|uniref:Uncharacterized protein n=1 Tax=Klebsormidium nitens TaxID=105231 RepID=A0A1Y1HRG7_KLENI|nr:hypothetical protein KFL_000740240 [Klebsormidium nitens]|eukprot:GAQ81224.1 hypothetical protein KFL_000740240 [Klebsormidium nitens]